MTPIITCRGVNWKQSYYKQLVLKYSGSQRAFAFAKHSFFFLCSSPFSAWITALGFNAEHTSHIIVCLCVCCFTNNVYSDSGVWQSFCFFYVRNRAKTDPVSSWSAEFVSLVSQLLLLWLQPACPTCTYSMWRSVLSVNDSQKGISSQ